MSTRSGGADPEPRVVLVRPWTDGHGGGGCCGGEVRDGIALDGSRLAPAPDPAHVHAPAPADVVGEVWRAVRAALPAVDVQVVSAGNPWLAAHVLRAVRRHDGLGAGLRAALGSSAAGAVLVDGRRVADLETEPVATVVEAVVDAVVAAVAGHTRAGGGGQPRAR
ncbi:hypothetical protein [Nocardioides perillae]|uniref:Uncharacterized protein n=1 Tax=Nocardioides perillae TaxID=1119534 RepID=A0A7Y9RTF9_9ACTN|nr:hypothetical protein [Nocardioides perillae]NYG55009.1 hypothetical protein [Nocardioides perillae]